MSIHFPPQYEDVIRKIASLPQKAFSELTTALENARPTTHSARLTGEIRRSMTSEMPSLDDIISDLVNISIDLQRDRITIESFANEAASAITGKKPEKDRLALEKRIASLLRFQCIQISARAGRLQREYENVFLSGRIMSDIRPVFGFSGTDVVGAIMMHNLKVTYYGAEGDPREIFFALDNDDLEALKSIIERAESKAASMEQLIRKAEVDPLDARKE